MYRDQSSALPMHVNQIDVRCFETTAPGVENRRQISDFMDSTVGRWAESVVRARPKTQPLIYFLRRADQQSGRLVQR